MIYTASQMIRQTIMCTRLFTIKYIIYTYFFCSAFFVFIYTKPKFVIRYEDANQTKRDLSGLLTGYEKTH